MTDGFEQPVTGDKQSFYLINKCTKNVRLQSVSIFEGRRAYLQQYGFSRNRAFLLIIEVSSIMGLTFYITS
jgi:hypothetical protein